MRRLILAATFFGLGAAAAAAAAAANFQLLPWHEKALEIVKAEKKVVDAIWSARMSFWVSMRDDGSRRDGYADYVCSLLRDAGKPAGEFVVIKVWDHNAMLREELKEIGRAECQ